MATQSDFPVNTPVVSAANHNRKGIVIGNTLRNTATVAVEWNDGNLARVNVSDILTESSLEDEFKAFQKEVNDKLAEACKLIREAATMAESKGKDLHDFDSDAEESLFDTYQLQSAMRDAGWNTSSWNC